MRLESTQSGRQISNLKSKASDSLGINDNAQNQSEGEEDSSWQSPPNQDVYESQSFCALDLSEEEEISEGQLQEKELVQKYGLWDNPTALSSSAQMMDQLLRFGSRSQIEYRFLALDTAIPFASSCCNGAIAFSRGLLTRLDSKETLFFGAHEMAHTELRHFATRQRRLSELEQSIPAAQGNSARMRLEMAAVIAVRHQEEFEADSLAARWLGSDCARRSLKSLHDLCLKDHPESLQRPTHPAFEKRLASLSSSQQIAFDSINYLWSLLEG